MNDFIMNTPKKVYDFWKTYSHGNAIINNFRSNYIINSVAVEAWKKINGTITIKKVIDSLATKYNISYDVIYRDILELLIYWHNENLIVIDYDPLFKLGVNNEKIQLDFSKIYTSNVSNMGELDVLFIVPPSPTFPSNVLSYYYNFSALGVGYLFSTLDKEMDIKIGLSNLWDTILSEQSFSKFLQETSPKIIAISCMTDNYLNGIRIAKFSKQLLGESVVIVMGGPHVTFNYKEALNTNYVDVCFIRESENNFPKFIKLFLENDNRWKEIRGLAYKDNKEIKFTGYLDFEEILGKLPFPKRILREFGNKKYTPIISSRGCPFSCKFCAAGKLSGNKYRLRNISNIINEIEFMNKLQKV